ncbi:alpha-mannosidase [Paenibacillus baekrokdamisoli]|uniref:Alpha-mannosidase n=1 Tax=Paenibacillus baekrokdamisoli TaxID=1712516 RepID=A0A3G9IXP8_9BACL|nr:glycoside hydrolase family 38 C-terminal domain-containing protein [Paenibacillus baekrokdamisoli]MBB3068841.1 alpha-mannosidase [Paenibacillus baekrokdamisoli]BBH23667.1 alpha-mannosidase [Paenibacillus baekrokdamisoli]
MAKKIVHIISHSHWDREWYMPFEKFRIRLVDLIDRTLELLESKEGGFQYFHLDGHVLLVDDYLEIRPEQEQRLRKLVEAGKLYIGPWYVLQDAFLTSGEAQIRNLQFGIQRSEQLGSATKVGYFPDTFGNISQSAQLLQGFEIHTAVFGRGINSVAENNTLTNDQNSGYHSELWWESPDGSKVLSVFMANWYHNGMELPTEPKAALARAEVILNNVQKYSTSQHLLLMNGCDHQPVQSDVGAAIRTLNEVMPDYTFIHSNFPLYLDSLQNDIRPWETVQGELISEFTDGWSTLVNTASSRMYLKQWNVKVQTELERWVEPFAAIADQQGRDYPAALVRYAWKLLLQNHPHDSICGCSVDEVHDEMVTRYRKAMQVAETLSSKALEFIAANVDTGNLDSAGIPLIVFNPLGWERNEWVDALIDVETELPLKRYALLDIHGNEVDYECEDLGIVNGFTLPDEVFRIPWQKRRYKLSFKASRVPSLGHTTYLFTNRTSAPSAEDAVQEQSACRVTNGSALMENDYYSIEVCPKGLVSIKDKITGKTFHDLLTLEDSGDIGNEYLYRNAEGAEPIVSGNDRVEMKLLSTGSISKLSIKHVLKLPAEREGNVRSMRMRDQVVVIDISLPMNARRIDVEVKLDNRIKDHRLRVLFPTDLNTEFVHADAPFDVVRRNIKPWGERTNPSNCERMQSFFDLSDGKDGMMIVSSGLPEYEVLRDGRNTMALTLLRCVGELGDWNYFPTPGAQCLGDYSARFSIISHKGDYRSALQQAYEFNVPMRVVPAEVHSGTIAPELSWVKLSAEPSVQLTALKKADTCDGLTLRFVNLSDREENIQVSGELCKNAIGANETLLNEKNIRPIEGVDESLKATVPAKRMSTFILEGSKSNRK